MRAETSSQYHLGTPAPRAEGERGNGVCASQSAWMITK